MITEKRIAYKPFEYEWAYDYWLKQRQSTWLHTEINHEKDVKDWKTIVTTEEKNVIGNILKGFAQTETEVEDYWVGKVRKWFPKPEIIKMAVEFGAMEGIHAEAYSYLNDTLGLDDYEAFLHDEATMNKLEVLMNINEDDTVDTLEDIGRGIAIFSACAEGIQLFSSFAVLLSFSQDKSRPNLLKGIQEQIEYSCRDESLHSKAGCHLYRVLCAENKGLREKLEGSIREAVELSLEAEFKYIDMIFELGDIATIASSELKNFMYDRANRKLVELGYSGSYEVDEDLLAKMSWFYMLTSADAQKDFFWGKETAYGLSNADWNKVTMEDISKLSNKYN